MKLALWLRPMPSWGNTDTLGSQAGYFILLAERKISNNDWSSISPLRWKSYKMDRKTQSTLGSELMSATRAVAECNWIRSMIAEFCNKEYSLEKDKHWREKMHMIIAVDNKPVYDHVQGEGMIVKDKRIAIDMLLLRRDLLATNATIRWVDTRQMLSDALTKINVNIEFLLFVLKFNKFILVKENQSLEWRAQEKLIREQTKTSSRKKTLKC